MREHIDIVAENLGKTFSNGTKHLIAIENVAIEVGRGKLFCIVGPSGCGKSTLLRLLIGLLEPTTGKVILDLDRRNKGIAYVQQTASLLPWRTVLQNALLGAELKGPLNSTIVERIKNGIREYGLAGFEQSMPPELSGGMRQKVDIIRAIESRPKILFCDEPFSAIDFVTRLELSTRFKKMCRVHGITTVFVTHNIEEAIFLGDEIVVMSGRPGRIISKYIPALSIGSEDAVKCRESPEFSDLFFKIWKDLGNENSLSH
ncbi:MAG: ATP-binding cassette domain-containing protein [Candidatus Marinimicrobia bacterium]|nr:ATP-binding cassette domain-containing protein [Candidatus Neomarinimicrobiota bacterium]